MAFSARIPREPVARMGRIRDGDDAKHLAQLRLLPCAVFGTRDRVEAHHLMHGIDEKPKGMARKNEDKWAIPLSHAAHHLGVHKAGDEEAWLMERGVSGRELAKALWACRGKDLAAYERVILRHAQERAMRVKQ